MDADRRCSMRVLTKDGKVPKLKKYGAKEETILVPPMRPLSLTRRKGPLTHKIEFTDRGQVHQITVIKDQATTNGLLNPSVINTTNNYS